jgi:hypothetical protein
VFLRSFPGIIRKTKSRTFVLWIVGCNALENWSGSKPKPATQLFGREIR